MKGIGDWSTRYFLFKKKEYKWDAIFFFKINVRRQINFFFLHIRSDPSTCTFRYFEIYQLKLQATKSLIFIETNAVSYLHTYGPDNSFDYIILLLDLFFLFYIDFSIMTQYYS